MIICNIETIKKRAVTTKVDLKTNFSRPRLVKLADPPPQDLPKPVPFVCKRTKVTIMVANIDCIISSVFCITHLLYRLFFPIANRRYFTNQ